MLRNKSEERSSLPETLFVVKSRTSVRCLIAKNVDILCRNQDYQISKFNVTAEREKKALNQLKKKISTAELNKNQHTRCVCVV